MLGLLQRDLQLRAAARRLVAQELFRRDRQRRGQRFDQRELRLAPPVFQQRQCRRRPPDPGAELGKGEAAGPPQVAQALPEGSEIDGKIRGSVGTAGDAPGTIRTTTKV